MGVREVNLSFSQGEKGGDYVGLQWAKCSFWGSGGSGVGGRVDRDGGCGKMGD